MTKNRDAKLEHFEFNSTDDVDSLHSNIVGFVPRYVSNRRDDYAKLIKSIEGSDFEAIKDYCHKVVGTARSYHFFRLEEITTVLQTLCRQGDIQGIRDLMPAYDAYIKGLFAQYLPETSKRNK